MAWTKRTTRDSAILFLVLAHLQQPLALAAAPQMPDRASVLAQFGQEISGMGGGVSEYSYRGDKDDVLVPVYMMGSINRPGLYHVPLKSELMTVISIAGGLGTDANFDSIKIKDTRTGKSVKVSMDDIVAEGKQKSYPLLGSEIIYVEKSEPWISNNTMLVLGFASSLLAIFVAARALEKK